MRTWFRKTTKDSDPIPEEQEHEREHDPFSASDSLYLVPYPDEFDALQRITPSGHPPTRHPHRPIQYPSPRLETLYISDQERSLYLAALSTFETSTPDLTLHADPPPTLPKVEVSTTPLVTPNVPYPSTPLVNAPTYPAGSKRPTTAKHAILTLVDDAGLRFTGFPAAAVVSADEAIKTAWKFGVSARSSDPDKLAALKEPIVYRVELKGKAWNRKGSQELESIRLLLAIFTALGKEGYKVGGTIASMGKNDTRTLLFRALPEDDAPAPLFFALSLPLPDRLALVSPPQAVTDELIDAVRASIFENASEIKMEGWVHAGVYRFWIAGMRRLVGGVKNETIVKLLPPLMVNIMDSLAALHFEWVTSIPLEPSGPGRDVLVFSSTAKSGLGMQDTFVEEAVTMDKVSGKTKIPSPDPSPSNAPTTASESIFNAFMPASHQQQPVLMPTLRPPPVSTPTGGRQIAQPPFPPSFTPANGESFSQPTAAPNHLAGPAANPVATRWSQPLPDNGPRQSHTDPPGVPRPQRGLSLDNDLSSAAKGMEVGQYHQVVRPARHPGRGLPMEYSATSTSGISLVNHFPDPPRRTSDKWEQIVRNSTPGRYPTHLPTADNTPTPIANTHSLSQSYKDPGFPTNPTFPQPKEKVKAKEQPRTPPKVPSPTGPPKHTRPPAGPTTLYQPATIEQPRANGPPVRVNGFITVNAPADMGGYAAKRQQQPQQSQRQVLPRSSVDSTDTQQSYYSSTEDHYLVTPNLTSTSINLNYSNNFPFEDDDMTTPLKKPQLKPQTKAAPVPASAAATATALRTARPLPPPPRKNNFSTDGSTTAAPTPAPPSNGRESATPKRRSREKTSSSSSSRVADEPPQLTVPRTKPLTFEDLRNVRLSAAFDESRSTLHRHSLAGSDFSVKTGTTSASSRPPGVGSARARVSLSRASKAA